MSSRWWRLTITADNSDSDAIAALVVAATGNGVEEQSAGVLCTTLETAVDADRLTAELRAAFPDAKIDVVETEPVDWVTRWRDGITTRRFGRVILTPSWLPVQAAGDHVVVTIDPESAFGSGEHGSTRGALTLLERHLKPGDRVLDFGSGSGILAVAAIKLGARSAIGIEVDAQSNTIAEENADRNDVREHLTFLTGDADVLGPLSGPADLICSNILRSVNTMLMPAILASLALGGIVLFAGMEEPEEELFLPVLAAHGMERVDDVRDGNWWSVAARRA